MNGKSLAPVTAKEQPYPLPAGWKWVRLGEVCCFIGGGTPNKNHPDYWKNGTIPWVTPKDMKKNVIEDSEEKITQDALENSSAVLIEQPALLIVMRSGILRRVLPLAITYKPVTVNQDMKALIPFGINLFYLFFCCQANESHIRAQCAKSGTTVESINSDALFKYIIPLPPLATQQKIVAQIESLFEKLNRVRELLATAQESFAERRAAILHKAFTGELIGKKQLEFIALEEICDNISIGPFGTMLHAEDYIEGGIPVINPKHIKDQAIFPQKNVSVSQKKHNQLLLYILRENDIVLGRRGDMGRCAPVTSIEDGWLCGTGSIVIRLKAAYSAKFYSSYISSITAVHYLEKQAVGSTMKNLNEKIVQRLPVPFFTEKEQQKIICLLDSLFEYEQKARELTDAMEQIDMMKKATLARAFRGKLSVAV